MDHPAFPSFTAIVLVPHSWRRLEKTLASLRRQSVRREIEIIVVHAAAAEMDRAQFAGFHSVRFLELAELASVAQGFATAFREGTAPVVSYVEDHVTLNPEWVERILEAHRGPWFAVAPAMEIANHPRSLIAWMTFLEGFVEWYGHRECRQVPAGPGHNTAYKRAMLETLGLELEHLYTSERTLCGLLAAAGGRMVVEPRAITSHMNISCLGSALQHAFIGGKIFGTHRVASMRLWEKIMRSALAPLVPPLRVWRLLRILGTRGKILDIRVIAALPALALGLIFHATGEVAGYWGDRRSAERAYRRFELDRASCVNERDRALLEAVG